MEHNNTFYTIIYIFCYFISLKTSKFISSEGKVIKRFADLLAPVKPFFPPLTHQQVTPRAFSDSARRVPTSSGPIKAFLTHNSARVRCNNFVTPYECLRRAEIPHDKKETSSLSAYVRLNAVEKNTLCF